MLIDKGKGHAVDLSDEVQPVSLGKLNADLSDD
jgi:hypothetical protein